MIFKCMLLKIGCESMAHQRIGAATAARPGLGGAIYRHLLEAYLRGTRAFSSNSIARELGISPNTANLAIRALEGIGAVTASRRSFEVTDFKKALMYWAALRRLERSIAYSTFVGIGAKAIEAKLPAGALPTAYSGYSALYGNDVADYGEVYVYATGPVISELGRRFPRKLLSAKSDYADLVVLRPDRVLEASIAAGRAGTAAPPTQICVDLWNIRGWQASRFFARLMERLDERLRVQPLAGV